MAMLEDGQREMFCQKWHETGNKSESYRYAYPKCLKWKAETIHKRASELSLEREVQGRYEELKQETAEKHGITIESLLRELEEARGIALAAETPQSSAAVSASMGKAKLVGLDVTKVEVSASEELTPWGVIEITVDG